MTEDRTPVAEYGPHRGMSVGLPAHKLPDGKFVESFNMRHREGRATSVEVQFLLFRLDTTETTDPTTLDQTYCTAIEPLFNEVYDALYLALTGERGYLLDFTATAMNAFIEFPLGTQLPDKNNRWSTISHFSGIYAANRMSGLWRFNGSPASDGSIGFTKVITAGPSMYPKYIENFHEHLVIANVVEDGINNPLRVAWSDIGDFVDFIPTSVNEADFYDLDPSGFTALSGRGITGLRKIGDMLAIYTSDSVWLMQYVGFDNGVMRIEEYVQGTGCWLPYALVGADRYHAFIARDNVYIFDGATFTPIGNDIRRFFYNDLTLDPTLRDRTWGCVNIHREEVSWYYFSRDAVEATGFDRAIVWNFRDRTWHIIHGAKRTAAVSIHGRSYNWIEILGRKSSSIDGLSGTIDGLAEIVDINFDIYATLDEQNVAALTRDAKDSDVVTGTIPPFLAYSNPYLITRDFTWSDPFIVHDIESMIVDFKGTYVNSNSKVDVYVNARDYLGEPDMDDPTFWKYLFAIDSTSQSQVSPTSTEKPYQMNYPLRESGRAFRFKFVFNNIVNVTFVGFGFNLHAGTSAER